MRVAAGTAVMAGTAGAVRHHQDQKYANQAAQQQAVATADQVAYDQQQMAAQMQAMAVKTSAIEKANACSSTIVAPDATSM